MVSGCTRPQLMPWFLEPMREKYLDECRLIVIEQVPQARVDVRPVPERPHVDLGHLRAVESFAQRPHQSPMDPDQLRCVDRVRLVQDDPQLKNQF